MRRPWVACENDVIIAYQILRIALSMASKLLFLVQKLGIEWSP
jgi:hypothetical protein